MYNIRLYVYVFKLFLDVTKRTHVHVSACLSLIRIIKSHVSEDTPRVRVRLLRVGMGRNCALVLQGPIYRRKPARVAFQQTLAFAPVYKAQAGWAQRCGHVSFADCGHGQHLRQRPKRVQPVCGTA